MRLCDCGASLEPYAAQRKFCDECRRARQAQATARHRARKALGNPPRQSNLCSDCGLPVGGSSYQRRYCKECIKRRHENCPAAKRKREEAEERKRNRTCTDCGTSLIKYEYGYRRKYCDPCREARNKEARKLFQVNNPERGKEASRKYWESRGGDWVKRAEARKRSLKSKGLTQKKYDEMVEGQNGVCAICGNPQSKTSKYGFLDVDHDHSCCENSKTCGKCIRGLLCRHCNMGLGCFKDNIELMQTAIEYLQKWREQ
jgi:hypothetical protein